MCNALTFYIDGRWTAPASDSRLDVENPATERVIGQVALGTASDVDRAVTAARRAFASWSESSRETRLGLLAESIAAYDRRAGELAEAISEEMGAPLSLARSTQVPLGRGHLVATLEALRSFRFEEPRGETLIVREPIGVCALITPWNWPVNQIAAKVAPAIATGCTMVLKPSEVAPFSGQIFAEILHTAGTPAGVFNLVHGDGPGVGALLSSHPDVDMVSFTGSTRAGVEVAKNAAPGVKRVAQELGGKSANIVIDDATFGAGVVRGVRQLMSNSGQSCNAPARMLVPAHRMAEAAAIAGDVAANIVVGPPVGDEGMGPVVSRAQWEKVQRLIRSGIAEGATLVTGGPGRPETLPTGYYVRPTVFADVTPEMTIAREEIFGPVLSIIGYQSLEDAVAIGNDTEYGLAGYVQSADLATARTIARQLRTGQVAINGASDRTAPFGGYKKSGNGREWGDYAFHEFVETKAIIGYAPAASAT